MIDEKILEKLKKLDDKEKIKKLLQKNLPDLKRFKDLEKFKEKEPKELSPEQREELKKYGKDFLEKFKEKKKIVPKVKPDPDRKIPKDFFKKFKDGKNPYFMPMPLPYDPNKKIPDLKKFGPYKIPPSDKMPGIQLLKKGGMVKGYKAGGQVKKDKSPNSGMITKRGWGASRKT